MIPARVHAGIIHIPRACTHHHRAALIWSLTQKLGSAIIAAIDAAQSVTQTNNEIRDLKSTIERR
jgi:hypothetical protein